MGDYEGMIVAWPLFIEGLRLMGSEGLAFVMGEFIGAALLGGAARVFGRNSLLLWLMTAVLGIIAFVDLVFLLGGFRSTLDLLTG